MQINNKKYFYELSQRGVLGNRAHQWLSYEDLIKSNWDDTVSFRCKVPGGQFKYMVPKSEWEKELIGLPIHNYIFSENPDDQRILIQAEFCDLVCGPYMKYSYLKKPQRAALTEGGLHAEGIVALEILRYFMDASSWDNFNRLRNEYPSHTIEITTYDYPVGIYGWNTVFWEVRNY